jgi:hypothetical protein
MKPSGLIRAAQWALALLLGFYLGILPLASARFGTHRPQCPCHPGPLTTLGNQ